MYSTVYHLTLRGWPECRQQVPWIARHFWGAQDKLSIDFGLLLKGTRVCVTPKLLNCTLVDLNGPQGINRMQAQVVREAVYWPSKDADITDNVCWCTICTKHKASPLHSLCYLEISPMAHGRRSLKITSPTRIESTYWYMICLTSTPFYIKFPPNLPNPYVCTCRNTYLSMDHLVCSTLTMACPLHPKSSCSFYSTIILTMSIHPPLPQV